MDILIVRAMAADGEAVARLVRELAGSSNEESRVDAACVGRYLAFPGRTVLLAIEDLFVRPAWRGRGVGRALVAHVMAEASRPGWAEVSVSTGRENRAALSLYRGLGLVEECVLLEKHFPSA